MLVSSFAHRTMEIGRTNVLCCVNFYSVVVMMPIHNGTAMSTCVRGKLISDGSQQWKIE